MEVFVHYPEVEEDKQALRQKVSAAHAKAVMECISKLACPLEQKIKLVQSIQDTGNGQKN